MSCPYVVYLPLIIKYWGDLLDELVLYYFSYDDKLLILTHTSGRFSRLTTKLFSVVSHTKISNKLF